MVEPVLDNLNIVRMSLENKERKLRFRTKRGELYQVDINRIPYKQGVILFNAKSKPVFWKGDVSANLEFFVSDYFR